MPEQEIIYASWSDDDEMVAFDVVHREVRRADRHDPSSDARRRGDRRQVFIVPADLSEEPRAITPLEDDVYGGCLMHRAGYHLISTGFEEDFHLVQYFLDGGEVLVLDLADPPAAFPEGLSHVDAVPSPDGLLIAIGVRDYELDAEMVGVIDAFSHETRLPFQFVEAGGLGSALRWTVDGEFFVQGGAHGVNEPNALLWVPDAVPALVEIPSPGCRGPLTTCGPVSEDGRIIRGGIDFETPFLFDDVNSDSSVGHELPFDCSR